MIYIFSSKNKFNELLALLLLMRVMRSNCVSNFLYYIYLHSLRINAIGGGGDMRIFENF